MVNGNGQDEGEENQPVSVNADFTQGQMRFLQTMKKDIIEDVKTMNEAMKKDITKDIIGEIRNLFEQRDVEKVKKTFKKISTQKRYTLLKELQRECFFSGIQGKC